MFVEIHEGRRGAVGVRGERLFKRPVGQCQAYSRNRAEIMVETEYKSASRARRLLSAEQELTVLKRRCPDDFRQFAVIFGEMMQQGVIHRPVKTRDDLKLLIPDFLFLQGQMDWKEIRKFVNYVNTKNVSSAELKGFWRSLRAGFLMEGEDVRWWFQVLGDYMNTSPNEHGYW